MTGEFSGEWEPYRRLAAERGFIYPPEGSRWDSWDDDEPSQRAILIRAIRETPHLLRSCIAESRTWGEVIGKLLAGRDRLREDATLNYREERWERQDDVSPRQAVETLGTIWQRVKDSV